MMWPLAYGSVHDLNILRDGYSDFGYRRKRYVHTGVDLTAPAGTSVVAVADGKVLLITDFTGPVAGSDWWLPTKAVIIEHDFGVVLYGELDPEEKLVYVNKGARNEEKTVRKGQVLGCVACIRKDPLPVVVNAQLHVEYWQNAEAVLRQYEFGKEKLPYDWPLDGKRPEGLMDPKLFLLDCVQTGE